MAWTFALLQYFRKHKRPRGSEWNYNAKIVYFCSHIEVNKTAQLPCESFQWCTKYGKENEDFRTEIIILRIWQYCYVYIQIKFTKVKSYLMLSRISSRSTELLEYLIFFETLALSIVKCS